MNVNSDGSVSMPTDENGQPTGTVPTVTITAATAGYFITPSNGHGLGNQQRRPGRLGDADLDTLRKDLKDYLQSRNDCINFVQALLFQLALHTGKEAISDPIAVFDAIRNQGAVVIDPTIPHPAEAWGALSTNPSHPATIKVSAMPFDGHSWYRGDLILSEVLHLAAKKGVYSDADLAWAGYEVAWAQGYHLSPPPTTMDTEANSKYFHNEVQFAACNPYQQKK